MNKDKFGTLQKGEEGYLVRFERLLSHPVEEVWEAITHPDKLEKWFAKAEIPKLAANEEIKIWLNDAERSLTTGKIIKVEKPALFEFHWNNDDGTYEVVKWKLMPEGNEACRLILMHSRANQKYALMLTAGWHIYLDQLGRAVWKERVTSIPLIKRIPKKKDPYSIIIQHLLKIYYESRTNHYRKNI